MGLNILNDEISFQTVNKDNTFEASKIEHKH
jgi:hypothetical protein